MDVEVDVEGAVVAAVIVGALVVSLTSEHFEEVVSSSDATVVPGVSSLPARFRSSTAALVPRSEPSGLSSSTSWTFPIVSMSAQLLVLEAADELPAPLSLLVLGVPRVRPSFSAASRSFSAFSSSRSSRAREPGGKNENVNDPFLPFAVEAAAASSNRPLPSCFVTFPRSSTTSLLHRQLTPGAEAEKQYPEAVRRRWRSSPWPAQKPPTLPTANSRDPK
mmetsp:Transcript_28675/g.72604  ORF Transcript_28675/g.72604 Transcript_28675/m.72604 type:complete len:220 (+) Transcript_28675:1653-2312(+)